MNKLRKIGATAGIAALLVAGSLAGGTAASAKSNTVSGNIPGGTIKAYAQIADQADSNNCGRFTARANTSKSIASLTNSVQWDPIGIGGSASISGVGVSVSGNGGGSPTASITGRNTTQAGIQGTACMSWSTIYLGMYSTASTRISNTFYTQTAHV